MFNKLFSIGYGPRSVEQTIALLKKFRIARLIDVRSFTASKKRLEYSASALKQKLEECGIAYVMLGDELGGYPQFNKETLEADGGVNYAKMQELPCFKQGIAQLLEIMRQKESCAILCSELQPEYCHRSRLIGRVLEREHCVEMQHINAAGGITSQKEVMDKVVKVLRQQINLPVVKFK